MTYNVRKFNIYNWININNIDTKIKEFISNMDPDILVLQEYKRSENFKLNYPYSYNRYRYNNKRKEHVQSGLVIYSKYPIINKSTVGYGEFMSGVIYADIVKNNDTVRIFNFHLKSLGVIPDEDYFGHKNSEKLIKRLSNSFVAQQKQIETLNNLIKECPYRIIVAGDLNNTAYSWVYKNIKNDLHDSFLEAGKGFGKTYEFKKFPLRIDYIFADKSIKFINHKNLKQNFSDHYPILATLEL